MSEGISKSDILGSWRLDTLVEIPADGGAERFPFDPSSTGYFHFLEDDRVSSLVAFGDRIPSA